MFYIPFAIAVLSSVLYHTFQKAISPTVNPVLSLLVTYAVAFLLSLLLFTIFPLRTTVLDGIKEMNWASVALAVGVVGLEAGFLLAYRGGWNLNLTAVASNVSAGLILIPLGIVLFKEKPSLINLMGVLVCIAGLIMINQRGS